MKLLERAKNIKKNARRSGCRVRSTLTASQALPTPPTPPTQSTLLADPRPPRGKSTCRKTSIRSPRFVLII